jgi:hypothetical protein
VGRAGHSSSFRRRFVALAAVYALVISSFIASFGAATAAAEQALDPSIVICHHDASGQLDPLQGHGDSGGCADCGCCIGCLMPLAALAAPPVAVPLPEGASYRIALISHAAITGARETKSHRARAPPLRA